MLYQNRFWCRVLYSLVYYSYYCIFNEFRVFHYAWWLKVNCQVSALKIIYRVGCNLKKSQIQLKWYKAPCFVMYNSICWKMFLKVFPISVCAAHYTVCMPSISKCTAVFLLVTWIILYMFLPKVLNKGKMQSSYPAFLNCFWYLALLASRHLRINGDYRETLTEILIFLCWWFVWL